MTAAHRNGDKRKDTATLTARQEGVAVSLAAGLSIEAAARKEGIAAITVKKWLREQPALRVRIRWLRVQMTERALGLLADGMAQAAVTLRRLLRSESEAMRHKAAESLLTHGAQLSALAELQDRLEALEANQPRRGR
jgi:hypothetical protein